MTLFDYHVRLDRGRDGVVMTARAEDWATAKRALIAALPDGWRGDAVLSFEEVRQVVADAARAEVLERRVHELEQSLAESNSQVEVEREAAVGMAATITAQQQELERLNAEAEAFGRALVKIVRMDDSADALDEAKGWARDAFAEANVTIPGITTPIKIISPETKEV